MSAHYGGGGGIGGDTFVNIRIRRRFDLGAPLALPDQSRALEHEHDAAAKSSGSGSSGMPKRSYCRACGMVTPYPRRAHSGSPVEPILFIWSRIWLRVARTAFGTCARKIWQLDSAHDVPGAPKRIDSKIISQTRVRQNERATRVSLPRPLEFRERVTPLVETMKRLRKLRAWRSAGPCACAPA